MQLLFVAALLTLSIILIFAGVARMISVPSRAGMVVEQYGRPRTMQEMEFEQPFTARVMRPILRSIANVVLRFTPQGVMDSTRHKLDLAGNPFDLPALEFLGVRSVFTILGVVVLSGLFGLLHSSEVMILVFGLIGAVLGFYGPVLWLDLRIRERQEGILVELPDALDLLAVCAEAGLGLDAGFAQLVNKWDNHVTRAFSRLTFEMRLGKAREVALRDLADRAGVRELSDFIAAVIQAEKFGAGIVQVLRIQSDQQRVLRRQRAQNRANQLPVKLLFPLAFFIFPSILIIILGPAVIRIMEGLKF